MRRTLTALTAALVTAAGLIVHAPTAQALGPGAFPAEAPTPPHPMRMWFDKPAANSDAGWIDDSIPMGNAYLGANLFGGVATERLQLTENSVQDSDGDSIGGLDSLAEVSLDFPHTTSTTTAANCCWTTRWPRCPTTTLGCGSPVRSSPATLTR